MKQDDKELLMLAAKAAQISRQWDGSLVDKDHAEKVWSPLTDDGDALRLAVKLNMCVTSFTDEQMVGYVINREGHNIHEAPGTDPYAATRRAIVRAAAEIAKAT